MNKTEEVIQRLFQANPLDSTLTPSELINTYFRLYEDLRVNDPSIRNNNSLNGNVFEALLMIALIRAGITPIYAQANMALVPNIVFDIVLYNRKTPIILSAKTTLRERWKQADLEAMAVKYVHRQARCYVLTMSDSEVNARRRDSNSYVGIDSFILAHTTEFDELVAELATIEIGESEMIDLIDNSANKIITSENIEANYGLIF